ncbi:MAG TPA: hypothetical protein VNT99_07330, partial [Methylomirabilota bacterium]|nr:hypothetical protein [Methylomirabilota bacterium]
MNPAPPKPTRRFWIWGFIFLFLLHAFAVFWLAERRDEMPAQQKPAPFFFVSSDAMTDQRLAESVARRDPTLYSVPHAHGFSGGAWLRFRPPSPKLTNWSAPPEWLALPNEPLGASLSDYVATNQPSEEQLLGSLRVTKAPDVRIPDVPVVTQTMVKVVGRLAARRLIRVPPLPAAAHVDLLRRTVLTVSVNGD